MASTGTLIRPLWQHQVELKNVKKNLFYLCITVSVIVLSEDSCVRGTSWRDMNCHRSDQILFSAVGRPRIICSQIGV